MEAISWLLVGIITVIISGVLAALPVWLLWNALMPVIFSLPTITFLQALGLSLLSSCLFKSSSSSSSSSK